MFKRIGIGLVAALILVGANFGSARAQGYIPDHCLTGLHQNAVINISSATTTSIIAPVTGANIYLCHIFLSQAGGTGTVQIEYGTGSTCATGLQALTGLITANSTAGTTTNISEGSGQGTLISTNAGAGAMVPSQRLCILSTGTIVQGGYLTFVQE